MLNYRRNRRVPSSPAHTHSWSLLGLQHMFHHSHMERRDRRAPLLMESEEMIHACNMHHICVLYPAPSPPVSKMLYISNLFGAEMTHFNTEHKSAYFKLLLSVFVILQWFLVWCFKLQSSLAVNLSLINTSQSYIRDHMLTQTKIIVIIGETHAGWHSKK